MAILETTGFSWVDSSPTVIEGYSDGMAAMRALQEYLQDRLNADFWNVFIDNNEAYIVPDVVLEDDEPQEADQVGKPYILLSLDRDELSELSDARGTMRECEIEAVCIASDFSGAQVGTGNPIGSDTLLGQALAEIIRDDYTIFRDTLGMQGMAIKAQPEVITQTSSGEIHRNPYRITFVYENA